MRRASNATSKSAWPCGSSSAATPCSSSWSSSTGSTCAPSTPTVCGAGSTATKANPCTDGLGNPITHEIAKSTPWYTVSIAILVVIAAALDLGGGALVAAPGEAEHDQRGRGARAGRRGGGDRGAVLPVRASCPSPPSTAPMPPPSSSSWARRWRTSPCWRSSSWGCGAGRSRGRYDGGHWYQVRIIRIFAVWLATSTCILAVVMIAFS